jgi:murein DD-endopeptidase MepM/ murein hydrolase activator NlpD
MLPPLRTTAVVVVFLALAPAARAWSWPASGAVLRPFSLGDDPYLGGQHRGVDVGGTEGEPVLAPRAGTVVFAGSVPTNGLTVTIRTDDGYSVTLVHLGSLAVKRNAPVAEGDPVGVLGTSGEAEWPV